MIWEDWLLKEDHIHPCYLACLIFKLFWRPLRSREMRAEEEVRRQEARGNLRYKVGGESLQSIWTHKYICHRGSVWLLTQSKKPRHDLWATIELLQCQRHVKTRKITGFLTNKERLKGFVSKEQAGKKVAGGDRAEETWVCPPRSHKQVKSI